VQSCVGENIGEFGEMNVICQYFTQPNLSPFCKTLDFQIKILHMCEWRNSGAKMSILKYLHLLADAEAKFDPSGQSSLSS